MASSYKIKRSKESRIVYCISSVFVLYQYIKLLSGIILNKSINLLLLYVLTLVLLLFFVIVYLDRVFLLNNHIVLIFAPLFLRAKYNEIEIIGSEYVTNKKNDYHFLKDDNQLCLKVKNKVIAISTNDNESLLSFLKGTNENKNIGDGPVCSDEK